MPFKLQKNFSSGELSPLLYLRSDKEEVHKSGLKHMVNMLPISQGTARSRFGFDFSESVPETFVRLFEFDVGFAESYLIVVGEVEIHIIDRNGRRQLNNIVLNHEFLQGSTSWSSFRATFTTGIVRLRAGAGVDPYVQQFLTTPDPSFEHTLKIKGVGPNGSGIINVHIGTTQGGQDIFTGAFVGLETVILFTPNAENFWVKVLSPSAGSDKVIDSITVEPITPVLSNGVKFPSPYARQDIIELQVERTPGGSTMYMFTRGAEPHELVLAPGNVWDFDPIEFDFGLDDAELPNPPPWGTEYPGSITFHDGRMFVGGTFSFPVTIWGSKPLEYIHFDLGDMNDQKEDDAIVLPLDKYGTIQWLRSNRRLFAGLDTGEHVVFGTNGPLSPENAQTEQHSSYGSKRIHAIVIEEQVAYVDTLGRKVRIMRFSESGDNWTSYDITFNSEHISVNLLSEMKYGRSPQSNLIFTDENGDMVLCVYEQDQGTIGWSKIITDGNIVSVAVLTEFGVDVVWIAVERNGQLFIERNSVNNKNYMDSAKTVEFIDPTDTFPGFEHLAGLTVQILADGAIQPDQVVPEDGVITLVGTLAFKISVGLGFNALVETLPEQAERVDGNTLKFAKRYNEIYVAIIDSARPIINGINSYFRNPATPMDKPESVRTEIVEVKNLGWDTESSIIVEQPLPLPLEIAAIGGKIKESKV